MFEFSVAYKYLMPRRRQLSVSIISLIAIVVIALVVWLVLVFFSVTNGLEKNWVQKLTALTAPLRIIPTEAYYHSYYYQVDGLSEASGYALKTLREKRESAQTDPYDPDADEEIPPYWPHPDRHPDGSVKDLVKLVFTSIENLREIPGIQAQDFELTATHIRLLLSRRPSLSSFSGSRSSRLHSTLSYPAYLGNFEGTNRHLSDTLLPIENEDLNNVLLLTGTALNPDWDEGEEEQASFPPSLFHQRLKQFFSIVQVEKLRALPAGWSIPRHLFPIEGKWVVIAALKNQKVVRLIVPPQESDSTSLQESLEAQGLETKQGIVQFDTDNPTLILPHGEAEIPRRMILTLAGGSSFSAHLDNTSLEKALTIDQLFFDITLPIQGTTLKGRVPYQGIEIAAATLSPTPPDGLNAPWWIDRLIEPDGSVTFALPRDEAIGEGVALPKSFRDAGVLIGDRGSLSYLAPTASLLQEQRIPIYVAGFYDPGIIPIGGKFILASHEATSLIRSSHQQDDKTAITNGINVRFDRLDQADLVKEKLMEAFKKAGIHHYWQVETYREYEFTKEIMRELQSQKNLFMLIAIVVILVACSNIISMLIILVNDKKLEIGILRSMGASAASIALIFGISGAWIGILGSLVGITAAVMTLNNLDPLIHLLSRAQGHEMFNTGIYGRSLPHELSWEALGFVLAATGCLSLVAGLIPAIKAALLRPSESLKTGGG